MVRKATQADYDAITEIRKASALLPKKLLDNNYRLRVQRDGFLLRKTLTSKEFAEDLDKYFVCQAATVIK